MFSSLPLQSRGFLLPKEGPQRIAALLGALAYFRQTPVSQLARREITPKRAALITSLNRLFTCRPCISASFHPVPPALRMESGPDEEAHQYGVTITRPSSLFVQTGSAPSSTWTPSSIATTASQDSMASRSISMMRRGASVPQSSTSRGDIKSPGPPISYPTSLT